MKKIVLTILAAIMLTACNEERNELYNNPSVEYQGKFDGCDVKFVNRGYDKKSFFIARCDGTTTTTQNYEISHGKTTEVARTTVIVPPTTPQPYTATNPCIGMGGMAAQECRANQAKTKP